MEPISVIIWRFVRGAVATALAQTAVIQVNWNDPQQAFNALAISFASAFLLALSKATRNSGLSIKAPIIEKLPV